MPFPELYARRQDFYHQQCTRSAPVAQVLQMLRSTKSPNPLLPPSGVAPPLDCGELQFSRDNIAPEEER